MPTERPPDAPPPPQHDPRICATCTPPYRPVSFIGSPARQVAGQILSGDRYCWEIAVELVDILGLSTAYMLAVALSDAIVSQGKALLTASKDDL